MPTTTITFYDADNPGRTVAVDPDPQSVVTAGDRPDTAVITAPDGRQVRVVGDYHEVHVRLQAAAAQGHESGTAPRSNTSVS